MKRSLVRPILFSQHFAGRAQALRDAGLFDPLLNSDSKLFIDPLLLASSDSPFMRQAHGTLREHLGNVVRLITASRAVGDVAWRSARSLIDLKERPETCLGYGGSGISGSSRSRELVDRILTTTKEIVVLGESDPEIISLMGMFEEGVGPDTISDLTTNGILRDLCALTENYSELWDLPRRQFKDYYGFSLPENPFRYNTPILLVTHDVLRDLPLAADWQDVSRVAFENEKIRKAFNKYVGDIARATVTEKKQALRTIALQSLANFQIIFSSILGSSDHYDPRSDPLNLYRFRELLESKAEAFVSPGFEVKNPSREELKRVVKQIILHFATLVEKNNLWELLWDGTKPKRERAAQLVFFAVSEMFCRANNIDVSPETNSGGGPVDFKFSKGYANRIIVEIKLSKGQVVHGYKTQIAIYNDASDTDDSIFLVVDVGKMGGKLKAINRIRDDLLQQENIAPEIYVVNGKRRKSASDREDVDAVIETDYPDDDETGDPDLFDDFVDE